MKILFPNAVDVGCSDFVCMHGEVVQPLSVLQATEADEQLEDRPQARPVFVWTDEHIKGYFVMCYLALSMIRYLQYLMGEEGWKEVLSAEEIMTALKKPQVVVQGTYPGQCQPRVPKHSEAPEYEGSSQEHDSYPVPLSHEA
ncbi:MAG TPA: hypothetical protein PLF67_06845 [Sphaerochaeta sp.]|jgi:hypothetical protein|nr:hypothetical protein [Sphaerochaeta sp.]